jgi:hypothetical protein
MSYRRRHRWLSRMALGLALTSVLFAGRASVAAAKVDEGTSDARPVAKAIHDPEPLTITLVQAQQTPYMSLGMGTYGDSRELPEPFVADATDFPALQSDAATRPEPTNDGNWRIEWTDALPLGVGIVVLALLLGLALGQLRRPRLAGS